MVEDPANKPNYDLRRALIYHRTQRVDLAQSLITAIDFSDISSASLLREAADALVSYGFLDEAVETLAEVSRLEPGDLQSTERRLSILAALGEETTLRTVIRSLKAS